MTRTTTRAIPAGGPSPQDCTRSINLHGKARESRATRSGPGKAGFWKARAGGRGEEDSECWAATNAVHGRGGWQWGGLGWRVDKWENRLVGIDTILHAVTGKGSFSSCCRPPPDSFGTRKCSRPMYYYAGDLYSSLCEANYWVFEYWKGVYYPLKGRECDLFDHSCNCKVQRPFERNDLEHCFWCCLLCSATYLIPRQRNVIHPRSTRRGEANDEYYITYIVSYSSSEGGILGESSYVSLARDECS
jgi:hypothetical protein